MGYERHYDRTNSKEWLRAYEDVTSYQPCLEAYLFYGIIHGCSLQQIRFIAAFGGVQGFPVKVMYRILRSEVSQTS